MSERTYRLSPPDRTGWVLGLGGPQVVTLGAAIVLGVLLLQAGATIAVAGVPVVGACALALVRVGGRSLLEWVPPVWRWVRGRGGSAPPWLAPLRPLAGPEFDSPALPPPLDAQVILGVEGGAGQAAVAVVHDRRADTFAATLRVGGRQFALVERGDQEALLSLWGDALAPFCQERGPVVEVRWSEWAAPAGMEEQHAYLAEHGIDDPNDPAVVCYRQLLRTTAPVATRHEVLVTVVVTGGKVKARQGSTGDRK